jgi:hypothetical protein
VVFGFAGCTSNEANNLGENKKKETTLAPKQVGNEVNYGGIRMTISKPFISDSSMSFKQSSMLGTQTQAPSEGGAYLFYHVLAENVGENERSFPESSDIKLYLNGEEAGDEYSSIPGESVKIEGKKYNSFFRKVYNKDADTGVFPGVKIEGWNAHEVPGKNRSGGCYD